MGKQKSQNIARILTLFIVATLISNFAVAVASPFTIDESPTEHWSTDNHKLNDDSKLNDRNPQSQSAENSKLKFDGDSVMKSLQEGDWMKCLQNFNPENMTSENKTSESDEDHNGGDHNGGYDRGSGGCGYGGCGVPVVPIPMYGSPMYGAPAPMYGTPGMFGGEPSPIVPSEPTVCKSKVSSSKCHKDKCVLSKHKHKHKHKSKKHKAKKGC